MFCRYCGTKLREGAAFCPNCGKKISVATADKPVRMPETTDVLPNKDAKGSTRKKWIAAAVGIILVIGVAVGGFVILGNKKSVPVAEAPENTEADTARMAEVPEQEEPAKQEGSGEDGQETRTEQYGAYMLPYSDSMYWSEQDIGRMNADELRIARNEPYARHGYRFQDSELASYFGEKDWYHPVKDAVPDSEFNAYEKANLELIQKAEEKISDAG